MRKTSHLITVIASLPLEGVGWITLATWEPIDNLPHQVDVTTQRVVTISIGKSAVVIV